MISPTTIIPGAIAVGVANVFYKERAFNLFSIAAAYLGVLGYLLLGHMINDWPEQVRLYMGLAGIFSLIVLGVRYPTLGAFLLDDDQQPHQRRSWSSALVNEPVIMTLRNPHP